MKLIPLNGRHGKGKFAMVDDWNYDYAMKLRWSAFKKCHTIYAQSSIMVNGKRKSVRLHSYIMKTVGTRQIVDHRNHNGLDCQEHNMRKCSNSENMRNRTSAINSTSKYLGVSFDANEKRRKRWSADIASNGKSIRIGRFNTEENAAIAYNIFAEKIHGEFANYNIA